MLVIVGVKSREILAQVELVFFQLFLLFQTIYVDPIYLNFDFRSESSK